MGPRTVDTHRAAVWEWQQRSWRDSKVGLQARPPCRSGIRWLTVGQTHNSKCIPTTPAITLTVAKMFIQYWEWANGWSGHSRGQSLWALLVGQSQRTLRPSGWMEAESYPAALNLSTQTSHGRIPHLSIKNAFITYVQRSLKYPISKFGSKDLVKTGLYLTWKYESFYKHINNDVLISICFQRWAKAFWLNIHCVSFGTDIVGSDGAFLTSRNKKKQAEIFSLPEILPEGKKSEQAILSWAPS